MTTEIANTIHSSSLMIHIKSDIEILRRESELITCHSISDLIKFIITIAYLYMLLNGYAELRIMEMLGIDQKQQLLIENL